jgi:hypothetical protein
MKTDRFLQGFIFSIVLAGAMRIPAAAGPPQVSPASPESPAFREFTERVQEYVKLQKAVPRLRTTKHREEIVERRRALAQKIRETRANAKRGDIFTPEVSEEFRREIRSTFRGPNAARVRKTIRRAEPVPVWHPTVNGDYPESRPLTTLPPTLLRRLPQLPPEVAYRIDGHDFVLQDMEARVVIDFIPGALP